MDRLVFFVVDGSWTKIEDSHYMGLGIVGCYAYEQEPFLIRSRHYDLENGTSTMAEYQACVDALQYAKENAYKHIILVTDQQLSLTSIRKQMKTHAEDPWKSLLCEFEKLYVELSSRATVELVCYSKHIGHLQQYIKVQMFYKIAHLLSQSYKNDAALHFKTARVRHKEGTLYEVDGISAAIPIVSANPMQGMIQLAQQRHKEFPHTQFQLESYEEWEQDFRKLFMNEQIQTVKTLLTLPVIMPNGRQYVTWKHIYEDFFSFTFPNLGLFEEPKVTHLSYAHQQREVRIFAVQAEGAVRYLPHAGNVWDVANERLGTTDTYQVVHHNEFPFFTVQTNGNVSEVNTHG